MGATMARRRQEEKKKALDQKKKKQQVEIPEKVSQPKPKAKK